MSSTEIALLLVVAAVGLAGTVAGDQAASWVGLLVALGYFVGRPVLRWVDDPLDLLLALPVTAVVVALVIWGQRRFERR